MFQLIRLHKIQFILWLIASVSISLNVYLITSHELNKASSEDALSVSNEDSDEAYLSTSEFINNARVDNFAIADEEHGVDAKTSATAEYSIKKGETLNKALFNIGLDLKSVNKVNESVNRVFKASSLRPGDKIAFEKNITDQLEKRKISILTENNRVEVDYDPVKDTFEAKNIVLPVKNNVKFVSGKVSGSLFNSAKKAGADSGVIMEFINLFSYSTDFQRDIKLGDGFKILYEYQTTNAGKVIKTPKIVYAHITTNSDTKSIYRHVLLNGKIDYFDDKGNSVKKALLRTPVNGARLSSAYGMRQHPIYGYSKMHQGLDYSAPKGTAILAAGDGVVEFVKSQSRGYGKHVKIKHNGTYATLYAHMSRFADGIKPGKKVNQSQVIGYVGATGTATGPHLHYEVIEKGKKVNPSKTTFPKTPPLKGTELARFQNSLNKMESMIAEFEAGKRNDIALLTE